MKINYLILMILLISGCSAEQAEEFAFRKTMEYQLADDCGEDKECVKAVKEQIEACMEVSDWRKYVINNEDEAETNRFISRFFPCFKDSNGDAYFD